MDDGLIDRIYEAGAVPELWTGVLDEIARLAGGIGGVFLVPSLGRWMATPGIEEMMADFVTSGLINTNERTRRLLALTPVGFYRDVDIFSLEDLPAEPVYRDFFIPRGGGFGTATVIDAPSGDRMILHVERALSRGLVEPEAIDRLDALRPHLARASLLSARMEMQRAATAATTLDVLGLPGAVLGHHGRLIIGNKLLEGLVPTVVQDRHARLVLTNRDADQLLADAIAALGAPGGERVVSSVPVPATEDQPPVIVHLVPIRGEAHDVFRNTAAIVVVTSVVPREVPSAEVVQGLFDLTPTEAKVAREIGRGGTPAEIAAAHAVQTGTVRTQIKAILAKTGLHRQADLLGLLRGVSAAMPPPEAGR